MYRPRARVGYWVGKYLQAARAGEELGLTAAQWRPPYCVADAIEPEHRRVPPRQLVNGRRHTGHKARHSFNAIPVAEVEEHVVIPQLGAHRPRLGDALPPQEFGDI